MDVDGQPVGSPGGESTEQAFDCVICGQTSTSTENRPVGLVALLQPSAGQQSSLINNCVIIHTLITN